MHQIRVHLAARGTPVLGDRIYGSPAAWRHLPRPPRLCLHAGAIRLPVELLRALWPRDGIARRSSPDPAGGAEQARAPESGGTARQSLIQAPEPEDLRGFRAALTAVRPRR